jgi:hypothetical protein
LVTTFRSRLNFFCLFAFTFYILSTGPKNLMLVSPTFSFLKLEKESCCHMNKLLITLVYLFIAIDAELLEK